MIVKLGNVQKATCEECGEVQTHKAACETYRLKECQGKRFHNRNRTLYRRFKATDVQDGEAITIFQYVEWTIDAVCQLNRLDEIADTEYTNKVLWDILHYHFKREADC